MRKYRALGKAELRVLGHKLFPWDAWILPGGRSVYACFLFGLCQRDKYTPGDQKPFDIINGDTLLELLVT